MEIGCAQGHLTQILSQISNDVTAIDVSKAAIKSAKILTPKVKFINSSLENFKTTKKFDLVIAPEVIYYTNEKKAVFAKIKKLAPYLVMSNYMLWDYILALNLKDAKLLKTRHVFSLREPLKYCRISLWELS